MGGTVGGVYGVDLKCSIVRPQYWTSLSCLQLTLRFWKKFMRYVVHYHVSTSPCNSVGIDLNNTVYYTTKSLVFYYR